MHLFKYIVNHLTGQYLCTMFIFRLLLMVYGVVPIKSLLEEVWRLITWMEFAMGSPLYYSMTRIRLFICVKIRYFSKLV